MNISGVGNTGVDYTRYTSRQVEQEDTQRQAVEQQQERTVTVQQSAQSYAANSGSTQTAGSAVANASAELAESLQSSEDTGNQSLINKANAGSVLTQSELSRLKEVDPGLYSRAVKAEKAREELRLQMKQNPSGASRSAHSAIARNDGENEEVIRKALADEYREFSGKYDQAEFGMAL